MIKINDIMISLTLTNIGGELLAEVSGNHKSIIKVQDKSYFDGLTSITNINDYIQYKHNNKHKFVVIF